jgi:hypothetical protein
MFHLGFISIRPTTPEPPSDTIPTGTATVTVSDAGTTAANGEYTWSAGNSRWEKGDYAILYDSGMQYDMDAKWWIADTSVTSGLYNNEGGDSGNCPKEGWTAQAGDNPAPTLA